VTDIKRKIIIRIACEKDALALSKLAAILFHQAYLESMPSDVLNSYIAENFGVTQQLTELLDPNITTFIVEIENVLVGFAQLRLQPVPVALDFEVSAQLWRIYLDRSCHGLVVGRQLLSWLGESAREMFHDKIWLGVWEHNPKAIAFYTKLEFKEIGNQAFYIGTEIQNDLVFIGSTSDL
jgi:ribosomal protein S18 acetylase RimI-like enzyme